MVASPGATRATIARWRALLESAPARAPRVLVASSFTSQPMAPALGVALHEATGDVAAIDFADYNQLFQICLDPHLHGAADADEIVLIWRIEDVFERDLHAWGNGDDDALVRMIEAARSLAAAVGALSGRVDGSVIVSDAPTPIGFGLDHRDPDLLTRLVELQHAVNGAFDEALGEARVERLRLAALQHAAGTAASFDRRSWLMYRQPFVEAFVLDVGVAVADVIAARTRVPPKVLVLDCDDTLWAGVIADDGIGALQCNDAFPGFAFRSFQYALQRLRHQGVLLVLASKNDPERVLEAFAKVDGMVLDDDDITARRVSWDPKPPGVIEMAAELNLGLDAFVFVDDSEYEIGSMRTQLPMVRSLRVPEALEELPDLLAETGWFRLVRVTHDDRERTSRMRSESARAEAATVMSHDEFLASLDLAVRLIRVGAGELGRVTQLLNKTNQFNVTTIRRTEAEVAALVDDPDAHVHAVSVHDRFGDYGTVGVVISRRLPDGWDLDTVLMSCRVLGRGVETAMLAGVIAELRAEHPGVVTATYLDSGRNRLVAGLFPDHGFVPVEGDENHFVLDADATIDTPAHITVNHASDDS